MRWFVAISISLALHAAWWMYDEEEVQQVSISGGQQLAPLSVTFSVAVPQMAESQHQDQAIQPKEAKPEKRPEPLDEELVNLSKPKEKQPSPRVKPRRDDQVELEKSAKKTSAQIEKPIGVESLPVIEEVNYRRPPTPPEYPRSALRRKQQGEALVKALVNEQGKTERIELLRSSGYRALDQSALKAVSGWEFEAAAVDGKKIRAWVQVPVQFRIN